jgi:glycosyltransferase involved in cell wall biosynthesis
VITNSRAVKDVYGKRVGLSPDKIEVIYNGFDFTRLDQIARADRAEYRSRYGFGNDFIIVNVARVCEQKNQLCLIKAAGQLAKAGISGYRVIVVGGKLTGYYERIADHIKTNGLDGIVEFWGERRDVYRIMKAADAVVLPSLWEGFPNAVIEAMAIRTPVIVSDFPGSRELIRDRKNGFLFRSDDPADLSAKVRALMEMPERKTTAIANNARNFVHDNFKIDKTVAKTMAVYADCLKQTAD